jgi:hypothetical protein
LSLIFRNIMNFKSSESYLWKKICETPTFQITNTTQKVRCWTRLIWKSRKKTRKVRPHSAPWSAYYRKFKIFFYNFWIIINFYYEFRCVAQISVTSVITQFWETKKRLHCWYFSIPLILKTSQIVYFMYYDQTIKLGCVNSRK